MKQEYTIILIIGLFIASYVLEAIVQPLSLSLATPYHYLSIENLTTYPFSTTVIIVRAIGIFLAPIWLMSFFEKGYTTKAAIILVLAGLSQLYVLQELATGQQILPLEWSLAVSLAGLALVPMIPIFFLRSVLAKAHQSLTKEDNNEVGKESEQNGEKDSE